MSDKIKDNLRTICLITGLFCLLNEKSDLSFVSFLIVWLYLRLANKND